MRLLLWSGQLAKLTNANDNIKGSVRVRKEKIETLEAEEEKLKKELAAVKKELKAASGQAVVTASGEPMGMETEVLGGSNVEMMDARFSDGTRLA